MNNIELYDFQSTLVDWAVKQKRAAIFADTGLGKTFMQLEWARRIGERTLFITPLAVAQQTVREAQKMGMMLTYAREDIEGQFIITNYEMVDRFDLNGFGAVVLDESSILKGIDGKTRLKLTQLCENIENKLCLSATPAPNDNVEYGNHSEFLGNYSHKQMLSMFFVNDDDGWRLKGHAHAAFYRWLASWSMFVRLPSDIGFDDEAFLLPELKVTEQIVNADADSVAQQSGMLFHVGLDGIGSRIKARKFTVEQRVQRAAELINDSDDQWVVWCGLNDEGRKLAALVADATLIEGSTQLDKKLAGLDGFVQQTNRVLITKPSIAGFGLNMQNCHNMIFLGMNDSFEQYYQATRRCWRFGQTEPVNVHIVISDLEQDISNNIARKQETFNTTRAEMMTLAKTYQMEQLGMIDKPEYEYKTDVQTGTDYTIMLGDSCERMKEIETDSIDFSVFSPPFLSLFVYSDSDRDLGNTPDETTFFDKFNVILNELKRIVKPGRNIGIHVAQVAATLAHDGYIGIRDFRGGVIQSAIDSGLIYHGEVVIDKNPQAQAIRTHSKALLFAQLKRDSAALRPALPDYILLFQVPGDNEVPIHPDIDNETWIEWARPIWYGIRESDTLSAAEGRMEQDERHVAPLQLGTIERCVRLWSNEGETVFSPFAGVGSEGYESIRLERKFVGIELKPSYYNAACKNLERALMKRSQLSMF